MFFPTLEVCVIYAFNRNRWYPETTNLMLRRPLLSPWDYVPHPVRVPRGVLEWSEWAGSWERVWAVPTGLVLSGRIWSSVGSMQFWTLLSRRYTWAQRREYTGVKGKTAPKKYNFPPDLTRRGKKCPHNIL